MGKTLPIYVLLCAVVGCGAPQPTGFSPMTLDTTVGVPADDAAMLAAINQARDTIGRFFDALAAPEGKTSFLLKVAFSEGDEVEHIWLADLDFSSGLPTGVVANEPGLRGLQFMERVGFEPARVTDWMYVEDGRLVGGYTTRGLRCPGGVRVLGVPTCGPTTHCSGPRARLTPSPPAAEFQVR